MNTWERLVGEVSYRWDVIKFSVGFYPAILIGWMLAKYEQKRNKK